MFRINFNSYKETYKSEVDQAVSFSGKGVDYFAKVKCDYLLEAASRMCGPPSELKVLDVGCGVGVTDQYLVGRVGLLCGTDVAEESVGKAKEANPAVQYTVGREGELPYEDDSFDVSFAFCVFHHVPPPERAKLAEEMARVTRPGGLVAIFEHNPWNPLTRLVVSRCAFDADAILLCGGESEKLLLGAGLESVELGYILLLPWDVPLLAKVERGLRSLPLGAQYYAIGQCKS